MRQELRSEEQPRFSRNSETKQESSEQQSAAQAVLEDYLDRVCLPLVEDLPYPTRIELRREIAQHLQSLVDAYAEVGDQPLSAARNAVAKFGSPETVARAWRQTAGLETHNKPRQVKRWMRRQWPGMAAMAATFSACSLLALLFSGMHATPPQIVEKKSPTLQAMVPGFQHSIAVRTMDCTDCHRAPISGNAPMAKHRFAEQVKRFDNERRLRFENLREAQPQVKQ